MQSLSSNESCLPGRLALRSLSPQLPGAPSCYPQPTHPQNLELCGPDVRRCLTCSRSAPARLRRRRRCSKALGVGSAVLSRRRWSPAQPLLSRLRLQGPQPGAAIGLGGALVQTVVLVLGPSGCVLRFRLLNAV